MKPQRIKKILEMMLEINKYDQYLKCGLCTTVTVLWSENRISESDRKYVMKYIQENKPHPLSSIAALKSWGTPYFWPVGDIRPRIKWLNKHIKINSK